MALKALKSRSKPAEKKKMLEKLALHLWVRKFRAGVADQSLPEIKQNGKMESIEKCSSLHPLRVRKWLKYL